MRMMHYAVSAAVISALLPVAAQAVTYDIGTLTPGGLITKGYTLVSGKFADTIKFAVHPAMPGVGQYDVFTGLNDIKNATLTLTGPAGFTFAKMALTSGAPFNISFLSGNYVAKVSGTALGKAAYNFTITSAVPDAMGWATMALGISLAGVFARRRMGDTVG